MPDKGLRLRVLAGGGEGMTQNSDSVTGKCPACGALVAIEGRLTVVHNEPKYGLLLCLGSKQIPRNPESDRRPLWSEEGVR
jgi:hypothetical protein